MSTDTPKAMEAGRDLDVAVAAEVMGTTGIHPITVIDRHGTHTEPGTSGAPYRMPDGRMGVRVTQIPHYSTDIAAAWRVVEALRGRGFNVAVSCASGMVSWDVRGWNDETGARFIAHAETAPLAIARAALAAVRNRPTP